MSSARTCRLPLAIVALVAVGTGCDSTGADPDTIARFIAVGAEGTIQESLDGTSWTTRGSGITTGLTSVAAGRSGFVAVGVGGTIVTSPDGVTWTKRPAQTTADLSHVIFDDEKFIAVGGSWESGAVTIKSPDGRTWTPVESPSTYMFHAIAHGNDTLVAAAYHRSDLQTPALFTAVSSSGSSVSGWGQAQGPDFSDSLTIGDEIMVVGEFAVSVSRDGLTWEERPLPRKALLYGIASSATTFVIVGELGTIYTSTDGTEWTSQLTTLGTTFLSGVTHGDSTFVAIGEAGAIATSPDGVVWTRQVADTTKSLFDVAYGPVGR